MLCRLLLIATICSSVCFALAANEKKPAEKKVEEKLVAAGDNLVVEGIPPIPQSLAERVGRYTDFRAATILDWHPTKREMLISTRFAETNQVHHVKMPGGARTQITFFSDRVTAASYQPVKANYFVLSKDTGGGEWFQYYRYDLASGDVTLLTDGTSRNTEEVWSHAGDRLAFGSTGRNKQDMDIWTVHPSDPATRKLVVQNEGGGWSAADWSPDDKTLLLGEGISINESYLWLADVADGKKTLLTPKNADKDAVKIAYDPVAFSHDGQGIYVITDRDNEFRRLGYIDLKTKEHKYFTTAIKWDVELASLSHDGNVIAFVVNENGMSVLHLWDVKWNKEIATRKLPTGVIAGIKWHDNNQDLGFVMVSARSTADVYSIRVDGSGRSGSSEIQRWTESETGGLNPATFAEPQLVTWKSFDDREISGFLYKPPAKFTGKRPVIINIHGGPESQFRPIFLARNNYYINELGVAILFPNIRGSSGYGKTYLQLDNGYLREDSYKDIGALLDWIKTQPELDADRIMVTGGSYGGHMTLAIATLYNDRIRCSLDVVGMSNLVTFLEATEAYRRDLRRVEYGDERDPKMRAFLEKIAPLNHVKNITKPLFVVQGANDPRVPLSESEQMIATVRKNDTPVWYLMAKDEGHGFAKKKNADYQFYATILFIQKFLLGE